MVGDGGNFSATMYMYHHVPIYYIHMCIYIIITIYIHIYTHMACDVYDVHGAELWAHRRAVTSGPSTGGSCA